MNVYVDNNSKDLKIANENGSTQYRITIIYIIYLGVHDFVYTSKLYERQ